MAIRLTDVPELSCPELAQRIRISESLAALPEVEAQLKGHQNLARALVGQQAPNAPNEVQLEAVISIVGYLYDRPSAASGARFANVWRNSGASSMLRPWLKRRAVGVLS